MFKSSEEVRKILKERRLEKHPAYGVGASRLQDGRLFVLLKSVRNE